MNRSAVQISTLLAAPQPGLVAVPAFTQAALSAEGETRLAVIAITASVDVQLFGQDRTLFYAEPKGGRKVVVEAAPSVGIPFKGAASVAVRFTRESALLIDSALFLFRCRVCSLLRASAGQRAMTERKDYVFHFDCKVCVFDSCEILFFFVVIRAVCVYVCALTRRHCRFSQKCGTPRRPHFICLTCNPLPPFAAEEHRKRWRHIW